MINFAIALFDKIHWVFFSIFQHYFIVAQSVRHFLTTIFKDVFQKLFAMSNNSRCILFSLLISIRTLHNINSMNITIFERIIFSSSNSLQDFNVLIDALFEKLFYKFSLKFLETHHYDKCIFEFSRKRWRMNIFFVFISFFSNIFLSFSSFVKSNTFQTQLMRFTISSLMIRDEKFSSSQL